jgi:hypothetical protein
MSIAIDTSSNILKLKQLQLQFKSKINEYKTVYASYITTLQSNKNGYVVLPGKIYFGASEISQTNNTSQNVCQALCSSNDLCTGTTYNSISKKCKLFKGYGSLRNGGSSDNVIIKNVNQQLINLDTINSQLVEINKQMISIINTLQPSANTNTTILSTNNKALLTTNNDLLAEQRKIKKLLNDYNDIDKDYVDKSINVERTNSQYNLWLIIMIVALILVFKYLFFPNTTGNTLSIILWSIIIIFIILATFNLNNSIAYAIWILLIAIVLMMKMGLIPSF